MEEVTARYLRAILRTAICTQRGSLTPSGLERTRYGRSARCARNTIPIGDHVPTTGFSLKNAKFMGVPVYQNHVIRGTRIALRFSLHRKLRARSGHRRSRGSAIRIEDVIIPSDRLLT